MCKYSDRWRCAGLREEWARSHQVSELFGAMHDVHAFVYGVWAEVRPPPDSMITEFLVVSV